MNLADKEKQVVSISSGGKINDLDLLCPEPVIFRFGGRDFPIYPLPIKKLRALDTMQRVRLDGGEEALTKVVSAVHDILDVDVAFIEENLTAQGIVMLCQAIGMATENAMGPATGKKKEEPSSAPSAG
jgi:hypothetical protein